MEELMSVLAIAAEPATATRPAPVRGAPRGRPHAGHLRALPGDPAGHDAVVPATPVTVSIAIDGADPAGQDRVLSALRELLVAAGPDACVEVHQRSAPAAGAPGGGTISVDPRTRTVVRDGRPLHLSRLEYDLLLFLARHPRQVFSRGQLLAQVWGHTHATARTVDVHISRLRTKLGDQDLITTVYGLGYRLADDAAVTVAA